MERTIHNFGPGRVRVHRAWPTLVRCVPEPPAPLKTAVRWTRHVPGRYRARIGGVNDGIVRAMREVLRRREFHPGCGEAEVSTTRSAGKSREYGQRCRSRSTRTRRRYLLARHRSPRGRPSEYPRRDRARRRYRRPGGVVSFAVAGYPCSTAPYWQTFFGFGRRAAQTGPPCDGPDLPQTYPHTAIGGIGTNTTGKHASER